MRFIEAHRNLLLEEPFGMIKLLAEKFKRPKNFVLKLTNETDSSLQQFQKDAVLGGCGIRWTSAESVVRTVARICSSEFVLQIGKFRV